MEKAIDQEFSMRAVAVDRLKKMLDELPRGSGAKGKSTADFLRLQRMKWDGRPFDVLQGAGSPTDIFPTQQRP